MSAVTLRILSWSVVLAGAMLGSGHLVADASNAATRGPVALADAVTVEECLSGEAGPYDHVFQAFGYRPTATLRCGDPTKGVLHIDGGHPIDDPGSFTSCVQNIFSFGYLERPGETPNTSLYRFDYSGGSARGLYDNQTGDILTVYTSGATNEWLSCRNG